MVITQLQSSTILFLADFLYAFKKRKTVTVKLKVKNNGKRKSEKKSGRGEVVHLAQVQVSKLIIL